MFNHERHIRPSRRDVARRLCPGTFIVNDEGTITGTVIGWCQKAPKLKRDGTIRDAMTWEVLILQDGRLFREHWESMQDTMTVDEWMEWATRP